MGAHEAVLDHCGALGGTLVALHLSTLDAHAVRVAGELHHSSAWRTNMFTDLQSSDGQVTEGGTLMLQLGEQSIECTLEPRAGLAGLERWAERRACWRYGRYPRPGTAESTQQALRRAHGQTLECRAAGCGALVDLQAARRLARKAKRDYFLTGDGCASAVCSERHWRARFAEGEQRKAAALLSGERRLVLWPPTTAARGEIWALPACCAHEKASATLAARGAATAVAVLRVRGGMRGVQQGDALSPAVLAARSAAAPAYDALSTALLAGAAHSAEASAYAPAPPARAPRPPQARGQRAMRRLDEPGGIGDILAEESESEAEEEEADSALRAGDAAAAAAAAAAGKRRRDDTGEDEGAAAAGKPRRERSAAGTQQQRERAAARQAGKRRREAAVAAAGSAAAGDGVGGPGR